MKNSKLFLVLLALLLFTRAHAQNNTLEILGHNFSMDYQGHDIPIFKVLSMVEKPDGDIVMANLFRKRISPGSSLMENIGDGLYTISRHEVAVTDSTFIESKFGLNEDNNIVLLDHDPLGEGYVYVKFLNDRLTYPGCDGFTWLEIFHSDEHLNFNPESIIVPLEETRIVSPIGIVLEGDGNIVVSYVMDGVPVFARIGLDGTVKDKQSMPELFQGNLWKINGMVTFTQTPLEYSVYGWDTTPEGDTTFLFHVVDSLFNLKETVAIENNQSGHYLYFNNMISLLPYDNETYYVVSQFTKDPQDLYRNGLRIVRYDKASHEELGEILIYSYPIYHDLSLCAFSFGLMKSDEGNLYFGYRTCNNPSRGYITVMKLDSDLNTLWERRCYVMQLHESFSNYRMTTLNQGVVVCANHNTSLGYDGDYRFNTLLFLINDDGTIGTPEMEAFVRPYAFYPNPTTDVLILEYSPDVKPTSIELYDLQGRLVRSQRNGLESIDMGGLPAGTYTLRVTLEDGKAYTDKVVKE